MRCRCITCKENENGYCTCSSYVEISEDGSCDSMLVPTNISKTKEKE